MTRSPTPLFGTLLVAAAMACAVAAQAQQRVRPPNAPACTLAGRYSSGQGSWVTDFDPQEGRWRTFNSPADRTPALQGTYSIEGNQIEFHTPNYRCPRDVAAYRLRMNATCTAAHLSLVRDECNQLPADFVIDFTRVQQ